jgi:hypothetical protein
MVLKIKTKIIAETSACTNRLSNGRIDLYNGEMIAAKQNEIKKPGDYPAWFNG